LGELSARLDGCVGGGFKVSHYCSSALGDRVRKAFVARFLS
jgi:hypothetical protein